MDDARTEAEALNWIQKLTGYLDLIYASKSPVSPSEDPKVLAYITQNFHESDQSALRLLPTRLLPSEPLYELLEGFKMDLAFSHAGGNGKAYLPGNFPIKNEQGLQLYAARVASTVGELCLWLAFHHSDAQLPTEDKTKLVHAARVMGHALQYVNIARDIAVDADMGRVYLPTNWLKEEGATPRDIVKAPRQPVIEKLRERLLTLAFSEYAKSRPDMDLLPRDIKGPLVVAVESYMEIGRVLREKKGTISSKALKRATVPKSRRLWVAWKTLASQ